MRLAKKIFLLVFALFVTTITLDIMAQYYFYEFAYPSYKQHEIKSVVDNAREDILEYGFYSNDFLAYMNQVSENHIVNYELYSTQTEQLNVSLIPEDDIYFETREVEGVKTFYYFTVITFNDEKQLILEINYSLQVLGEMLVIFTNYYIFIFIVLAILVLLFSIWLTEQLTKPLLHMRQVTEHIAKIDFSEKCNVESNDELQELATNINIMSDNLHSTLSKLQVANERLQNEIAREREFEQMRSNFFATISHELKTPLTIIKGIANRIKSKPLNEEQVQEQLSSIVEEVDRMSSLVQETLMYMKMESATSDALNISSFNIKMLVEHLTNRLQTMMAEKDLNVSLDLEDIYVEADSDEIMTVMTNLYANAIRYSPNNAHIYISISRAGEVAKITIENTGVWIPEKDLEKIWMPFYRVEKSRNRNSGGTGLGLLIVSQILKLHQSQFDVKNTERGVQFSFELDIDVDFDD